MAIRKTFVDAHVRRLSVGRLYRAEFTLGDPARRVTSVRIFSAESLGIARAIGRDTPIAVMEQAGRALFESFFPADETAFGQQLRAQLAAAIWDQRFVLRLRIGPPELASIPWELMAAYPGETYRGALTNRRWLAIERTFQPLVTLPGNVTLPIRILVASLLSGRPNGETEFDLDRSLRQVFGSNAEEVVRSFQATSQSHASVERFEASLGPTPYDVLHLVGDLASLRRIGFTRLHRLTSARLLVLHVRGGEGRTWGALLRVAHRAARAVPAVIASQFTGSPATAAEFYHAFYDGLVHDLPIDEAMDTAREQLRYGFRDLSWAFPALFAAENAHDLLRVSPLADAARKRAEDMLDEVRAIRSTLAAVTGRSTVGPNARSLNSDVDARLARLSQLEANVRDGLQLADITAWDHESSGVVPLGNAIATLDTAAAALSREGMNAEDLAQLATVDTTRVVNTYFRTDVGTPVPPTDSIVAGNPYDLVVQIGPRLIESNVRAPVAIPEAVLEPFYGAAGVELEVAVFSSDFSVDNDRQRLMLGRVGPSRALPFRVTALRPAPSARLRVGIYFKQNLLQCLLVTAEVTEGVRTGRASGNQAEVEYVLSGDLENVERFPQRSFNIVTNERPDGTHTLDVLGSGFKREFTVPGDKLDNGAKELRKQLLEIGTVTTQDPPPYRYDADNSGSTAMLQQDVVALARTGARFFAALLPDIGPLEVADRLRDVLAGNATIQVSAVTSAQSVFPWAMVYSKRLVESSNNRVCQTFLDALDHGGAPGYLAQQECIARGCPNDDDPDIVCPSGFWGYKHFIEQPPSVHRTPEAEAAADSEPYTSADNAVLDIVVRGRPNVLMVVNQDLDLWSPHANAIEALRKGQLAFSRRERKTDLGKAIIDPNLHLVYFYCHGRRDANRAWLGIGAKHAEEAVYSSDLHGWNLRWSDRPLVFINGCQTVECTPDELLPFLKAFLYFRAAGVIGTEIAVPEVLAEKFGTEFLERFMGGPEPVSTIVRSLRLSLLEKRNLLGLGYTPYCMGGLRMHVQETPTLDVLMLEARRSPELTTIETEAPVLERVWTSAKLSHRIVSNDPRYGGARPPRKAEFLDALRGEWGRVLHLAVHGDGASLALTWSDEPNVATRVPTERLTPREIAGLPLAGAIVVSGACSSGMQTMVDAFARAGARAYVAPSSDVEWARLVPFFSRFYEQLAAGESVSHCLAAAAAHVPDIGSVYEDRIGGGSAVLDRG